MKIQTMENISTENSIQPSSISSNSKPSGLLSALSNINPNVISTLSKTLLPLLNKTNDNTPQNNQTTQQNSATTTQNNNQTNMQSNQINLDTQNTQNIPSENSQFSLDNLFGNLFGNKNKSQNLNTQQIANVNEFVNFQKNHNKNTITQQMEMHQRLINRLT